MLLIGDSENKGLSENLAKKLDAKLIYPEITVFPDSEKRVRIPEKVSGERVILVKAVYPPVDSCVLELAFLVDALTQNGADKIVGVVPYLPYMRADHLFRSGESVPLEVIIKMVQETGLHEIVIVDPHSIKTPEMFSIKVHNLSGFDVFASKIKEIEPNRENITIVSPDMGGIRRLQKLDEALGGANQVIINKDRDYESGHIKVAGTEGKVHGKCFVVDDIISTGKTIVQGVEKLREMGADEIYVFGTHAVFSPDASRILQESSAKKIFVTDSIPVREDEKFEKLEILSLADLISASIL